MRLQNFSVTQTKNPKSCFRDIENFSTPNLGVAERRDFAVWAGERANFLFALDWLGMRMVVVVAVVIQVEVEVAGLRVVVGVVVIPVRRVLTGVGADFRTFFLIAISSSFPLVAKDNF